MSPLTMGLAFAQGFDATGIALPPDGGSVRDPLTTWGGRPIEGPSITVIGQGASALLVREVRDGPFVRVEPVLDAVFGAGVGGQIPLSSRFGLGVALPVWFGTTSEQGARPGLGDLHLYAPVSVAYRPGQYGLSLVPFAHLPTGARQRFLGDPVGGGLMVSGAGHSGPMLITADLGLEGIAATGNPSWPGGLLGRFATSVGWAPTANFALHAEFRGRAPLSGGVISTPSEGLLTLKGRPDPRLLFTAGVGAAITRGPGAATPRFQFGVTIPLGPPPTEPDALQIGETPSKELRVVDTRGFPIEGVQLLGGRDVVVSDPDGFIEVPVRDLLKSDSLVLSHPAHLELDVLGLDTSLPFWEVTLARRPVPVAVSLVGPDGEPMPAAVVKMISADDPPRTPPEPEINDLGVRTWMLPPGSKWVTTMEADKMGGQARVLNIPPSRVEPIRVDVVLGFATDPTTELKVTVLDAAGDPVEDAAVAVDDRDFGTTGPGGVLDIAGLGRGDHSVTVRSSLYGETTVPEVVVGDDTEVTAVLAWPPGSVLAQVTDKDGQPLDATVTFQGPIVLPARQVGSDGQQLFVLRPGGWTARIEFEGLASQERRITVSEQSGVAIPLDVVLQPEPPGFAELVVRAIGPDGALIPGVAIRLDGQEVGETASDGQLTLLDLSLGDRTISGAAELLLPVEQTVRLFDGRQVLDLPLRWVSGVVEITTERRGVPTAMTVTAVGDREVPPVRTGVDGRARLVLPPGDWVVTGRTEAGEEVERRVTITGSDTPTDVSLQVLDGPAAVEVVVKDARGRPVDGAVVTVNGDRVGETQDGRLLVNGVVPGEATIAVAADGYEDVSTLAVLLDGEEVGVTLATPVQPVEVTVTGPTGPVEATLLLHGPDGNPRANTVPPKGTTLSLEAGSYEGVVRAPGLASQGVSVDVEQGRKSQELAVVLKAEAPDSAMVIAVEDTDGKPVSGVEVRQGEVVLGTTGAGGVLEVNPVADGSPLTVVPATDGLSPVQVPVQPGKTATLVLRDSDRPVEVVVIDAEGVPVGNTDVRVSGLPETVTVGADGKGQLELAPGTWTLISEVDGEMGSFTVTIVRDSEPELIVLEIGSVETTVQGSRMVLTRPVLFDLDQATLRPESSSLLDDVAALLRSDRSLALVEVAGHTDDQGGVAYNQDLSERRATAVRDALIERGVEPERLLRRGYGLSRPVRAGTDAAARQANRRVELDVLDQDDR